MTMRPGNAARLAALVVVALLMTPTSAAAAPPTITTAVIQTGLDIPWDLAFLPDGKMLVTERPGRIRIYASGEPGAALVRTAVLGLGVHAEGEAGLMGITVDPAFSSNRFVYVCVSRDVNGQWLNQLVRYRLSSSLFFVYRNVMIWGMHANTNHNGCAVEFGRDGKIWLTMGDAGAPGDAQDPSALNGKVLRINPDGSIPSDNPIMPLASRRTIVYSMGHRNPQGLAFTPQGRSTRSSTVRIAMTRSTEYRPAATTAGRATQAPECATPRMRAHADLQPHIGRPPGAPALRRWRHQGRRSRPAMRGAIGATTSSCPPSSRWMSAAFRAAMVAQR
jgi:Glucose / Sorbosone dehydrogenase